VQAHLQSTSPTLLVAYHAAQLHRIPAETNSTCLVAGRLQNGKNFPRCQQAKTVPAQQTSTCADVSFTPRPHTSIPTARTVQISKIALSLCASSTIQAHIAGSQVLVDCVLRRRSKDLPQPLPKATVCYSWAPTLHSRSHADALAVFGLCTSQGVCGEKAHGSICVIIGIER
jgi:hypothetical protein